LFVWNKVKKPNNAWFQYIFCRCKSKKKSANLPEHRNSHLVFCGFCVARSLVFCVMFCRPLFYLFHLAHCVFCPSIYGFWLPLWYLLTFSHCVVCPSIYGFWLPLWIKLIIILNVSEKQCQPNGTHITDTQIPLVTTTRLLTSRTYKPLHTTYLPNTSIKSGSINNTGLLLGLPLALVFAVMVLSVLRFTVSDYRFGIF
jgi:hypothetical protein